MHVFKLGARLIQKILKKQKQKKDIRLGKGIRNLKNPNILIRPGGGGVLLSISLFIYFLNYIFDFYTFRKSGRGQRC